MNIMIVDDEQLIRQRLINTISWDRIGCKICAEAINGVEAIELAIKFNPDIIVTDIRMPGLTGLELIEILKPKFPEVMFILLTGYNDFKYAQLAIKLGAFDFVLKPTDEEEILKIVSKAKTTILKHREECRIIEKAKLQESVETKISKELILNNIIANNDNILTSNGDIKSLTDFPEGRYCLLSLQEDGEYSLDFKNKYGKKLDLRTKILDFVNTDFIQFIDDLICLNKESVYVLYIIFKSSLEERVIKNIHTDMAKVLISNLLEDCNLSFSIGISNIYSNVDKIYVAFSESMEALEYKFYKGVNSINEFSELTHGKVIASTYFEKYIEKIHYQVLSFSTNLALEEIDKLMKELKGYHFDSITHFKATCIQFLHMSTLRLNEKYNFIDDFYKDMEVENAILGCSVVSEIEIFFHDFYCQLVELISFDTSTINNDGLSNSIIREVKNYIANNFSNKITLNTAAKSVYVTPSYLCRLIKKETGSNFTEIVLDFRLAKAKELLPDIRYKIYEVADMVGFTCSRNFSTKFKQKTGLTPKDYRNTVFNFHQD